MATGRGGPRQQAFFDRLRSLYEAAEAPTYESLAAYCRRNHQVASPSSLQEWIKGTTVPRSASTFRVLVEFLEILARRHLGSEHRTIIPAEWEALRSGPNVNAVAGAGHSLSRSLIRSMPGRIVRTPPRRRGVQVSDRWSLSRSLASDVHSTSQPECSADRVPERC
jgi:hypothetical protein